jgi:hypothetical protein
LLIFIDPLIAFALAVVLTGVLILVLQRRPLGGRIAWLFLLIFLATWAGGLWLRPIGPLWGGIAWLPFVLAGILLVLLFSATHQPEPPRDRHETLDFLEDMRKEHEVEKVTYQSLTVFFWVLITMLAAVIILRYLMIAS